jgi:hypothetical protein
MVFPTPFLLVRDIGAFRDKDFFSIEVADGTQ